MKTFLKSRGFLLLLGLAMMPFCAKAQVSVWDGTYTPWTKGTGTASDPFLIENARQLAYLATRVNNGLDANGGHVSNPNLHYKLMVDVDLNGSDTFQWTPIGYYVSNTNYQCFGGHFDGNNHTISGLYVSNKTEPCIGFFGLTDNAIIRCISVQGVLSGTNSFPFNPFKSYVSFIGGIVGYANHTCLTNCFFNGSISSHTGRAGVGYDEQFSCTGGIVGFADSGIVIQNCYTNGYFLSSGEHYAYSYLITGGIVGMVGMDYYNNYFYNDSAFAYISDSYNYAVTSTYVTYASPTIYANAGGIVGSVFGTAEINNCYYLSTCGGDNSCGGLSVSSVVMQTAEFVDMLNNETCAWRETVPKSVSC